MSDEKEQPVEGAPAEEVKEEVKQDTPQEDADDRGVPLQNVVAEMKRKLEAQEEELNALKTQPSPQQRPLVDTPATQAPAPRQKTREEVLEELAADPEGWIERKFAEKEEAKAKKEYQKRINDAETFIYEKNPKQHRENVAKVAQIIRKYDISMADPQRAVHNAWEILDQQSKLSMTAREREETQKTQQKKTQDEKRTKEIKNTQPSGGSKPKGQKVDTSGEYLQKMQNRGSEKDAENYFRNVWFTDEKK